jgi:hypothetical protein
MYYRNNNNNNNNNLEAQLNDQYLIFANEGEGSDAGSLSSLNTQSSSLIDNDQQYIYLKQWGPKFNNLSSLYNNNNYNDDDDNDDDNQYTSNNNNNNNNNNRLRNNY